MPHEAGKPESGWRAPEARRRPNRFRRTRRYTGGVTESAVLEQARALPERPGTRPRSHPRPANHELLCDLIGVSEAEYQRLEAHGIIVYAEDAT